MNYLKHLWNQPGRSQVNWVTCKRRREGRIFIDRREDKLSFLRADKENPDESLCQPEGKMPNIKLL